VGAVGTYTHFYVRKRVPCSAFLNGVTESPNMPDQDENKATRAANESSVFIAGCGCPDDVPPPIEEFRRSADASSASIVEQLASTDTADIEYEAPLSGRLFQAADFS
jgi:hypothetical protein